MITTNSQGRFCPSCGYTDSKVWFWNEEAWGVICPQCGKTVSLDGSILETRTMATVYYHEGQGWMVVCNAPGGRTVAGPYIFKEAAIREAKRDNPDEITIVDEKK